MIRTKTIIFAIFLAICFFVACFNAGNYENVKSDFASIKEICNQNVFDSIKKELPNYNHLNKVIKDLNLVFQQNILLPKNANFDFLNSKHIAFAFGMYSADLAYVREFERVQLCMDYLMIVRDIANKLAINDRDFNNLVPLIEQSIYDNETIFLVTDSVMDMGKKWFSNSEIHSISILYGTGFWFEMLFLGLSVSEDIEISEKYLNSHFEILDNMLLILEELSDDDIIKEIFSDIFMLNEKYQNNQSIKKDVELIRSNTISKFSFE